MGESLWPGFHPGATPVAIFEDERTLLFRHPSPPAGFSPVPERVGVWEYPGRFPEVTANSSVDIGGVSTATLMPGNPAASLRDRAGVLVHEAFHVFQRAKHKAWTANEAELFTYPVDSAALLALARLEIGALRRALMERKPNASLCWARAAMMFRSERFAQMPAGPTAYDRGTELNEGLANYVEGRATGRPDSMIISTNTFPPEAVRLRGYATGAAIARLLDRFSPTWRDSLEQNDSATLDGLLTRALGSLPANTTACEKRSGEREKMRTEADAAVAELQRQRTDRKQSFNGQPGWKLIVVTDGAPLFPQGFDPLNVQRVTSGEVLHSRWLKVGNGSGHLEVLDRLALTDAAGEHPLFNGVRRLTITGLPGEPSVAGENGNVNVKADGIAGEFRGVTVERDGQTVTIRILR